MWGKSSRDWPPGTQRFCDFGKCSSIKLENKLNWWLNWLWQLNRRNSSYYIVYSLYLEFIVLTIVAVRWQSFTVKIEHGRVHNTCLTLMILLMVLISIWMMNYSKITTEIAFIVKNNSRTSMFRITFRHFSTGSRICSFEKDKLNKS